MFKKQLRKLLHRPAKSSKKDFGHIFVLAGSLGMTGAPFLVAQAALRTGAGLVTIGLPQGLNKIVARKVQEAMTKPLPQTKNQTLSFSAYQKILDFIKKRKISILALGPGLSQNKSTQKLVRKIVEKINLPMVIDADGLKALVGHWESLLAATQNNHSIILTPHSGEFARLIKKTVKEIETQRERLAQDFAQKYKIILVLKGYQTLVVQPNHKVFKNQTGNPGLAKAGAGDVLTGMIAALLAQGFGAVEAAKLGVYLHGLAGDLAVREKTQAGLLASDMIERIPEAMMKEGV